MKLGSPTRIQIKPEEEGTKFRFLLTFHKRPQPVEFETSADGAMALLIALQRLQEKHKVPIPRVLRPSGKPSLRVVTSDEDE